MLDLPFGLDLRDYQRPLWNALIYDNYDRAIAVWPRRNGKDLISLNILIAKAIQRKGLYFYIAPFYTQVKSIIWNGADGSGRRFLDYIPPELIVKKHESDLKIELRNGSIIRLLGSDNMDAVVGNNPVGIIFTEFSLHKSYAWDLLRPVLAENGGWALFNGTPRGLNHFYDLFERARQSDKWFVQYLTRDLTGIPPLEAIQDDRDSGMSESMIEQEYYVSWTASTEETLIPLEFIEAAIKQTLIEQDLDFAPRIMGVDVAFAEKGDLAAIAKRQGRLAHNIDTYQGMDNMTFASRVASAIDDYKPEAVFIDAGRGEGVISRLHQLGYGDLIISVDFGSRPSNTLKYFNKRTEMWGEMAKWLKDPLTPQLPKDTDLARELSSITSDFNEKNQLTLVSKRQMKTKGIKSPDRADALALTFAQTVYLDDPPPNPFAHTGFDHLLGNQSNYDPLKHFSGGLSRAR